jgi:hypothetical protein
MGNPYMSDGPQSSPRKWQLERRAFIEHRAFWHGRFGLRDLKEVIGLSRAQASKDLNGYIEDHPGNLVYDKRAKAYVTGPKFEAKYVDLDAGEYMNDLLALAAGAAVPRSNWIAYRPDIVGTVVPARGVRPKTVRDVLLACEQGRYLQITYQSISTANPGSRKIAPHALAHDGLRWHVRAFCAKDEMFKDFVLGRMLATALGDNAESDPSEDRDWHETVTLRLAPHPDLSDSQRRIVELDYAMSGGIAEIDVRICLLFYNLKRLGLDADPEARRPQDQPIVLENADEIHQLLKGGAS